MSETGVWVTKDRFEDCQKHSAETLTSIKDEVFDLRKKVSDISDSINRWKGSMLAITTVASILGSAIAAAVMNYLFK